MITATFTLTVPALTDRTVWFANVAAWNNYWSAVPATVQLDPAPTTIYTPATFVDTDPCVQSIDGVVYNLVTNEAFQSLVAKVASMDAIIQLMRTELKDAGFITEAQ